MLKIVRFIAICLPLAIPAAASPANAQAAPRVEIGTMICTLSPGIGALIASRRRMACRLHLLSGQTENYVGTITRFGLDVGVTAGGLLTWRVFTRTRVTGPGRTIAGNYVGVSGEASVGLGAGAKVLVGGSRRSTMLQPLALVGNVGLNLAVGVTGMTLRYAPAGAA
jgi:hypothetical protein